MPSPRCGLRRGQHLGGSAFLAEGALRLADRGGAAFDELEDRLRRLVREQRVDDVALRRTPARRPRPSRSRRGWPRRRSMSLPSCSNVGGSTTSSPSTRATRTAATGPLRGMSEMWSAARGPSARACRVVVRSAERTVAMICVSLLYALGEERAHRAVDEARGEDFLVGGAPSRLKKPPGILPAANVFST